MNKISFAKATQLTQVGQSFTGEIALGYCLYLPVGGYIAAFGLRAAGAISNQERPLSLTCNFLRPAQPGEVNITPKIVKSGRSAELIEVEVRQNEKLIAIVLTWCGKERSGLSHMSEKPTSVTPDQALDVVEALAQSGTKTTPPLYDNVTIKLASGLNGNHFHAEDPKQDVWFSFANADSAARDTYLDFAQLLVPLDIQPWFAAGLPHFPESASLIPRTTVLSVLFEQEPEEDDVWFFLRCWSDFAEHGIFSANSSIWGTNGKKLGSSLVQYLA